MSSRQEDVSNAIWDTYEDLSNEAILGYLWSFTNPRAGLSGAYRCPKRSLFAGRVPQGQDAVLTELEGHGLVYYREKIVWVPERAANIHSRNVAVAKSMAKDLLEIEGSWAFAQFVRRYSARRVPWIARGIAEGSGATRYERVLRALNEGDLEILGTRSPDGVVQGSENLADHVGVEVSDRVAGGVGVGVGAEGDRKDDEDDPFLFLGDL